MKRRGRRQSGQALVEFIIVFPVFVLLLLGMMEFGFAFSDRLTLGNATREGARVGASLATGMSTACSGDPAGVDTSIVASLQFILKSGGSDVDLSHITAIKIFKATSTGAQSGSSVNTWTYTPGTGPDAGHRPRHRKARLQPIEHELGGVHAEQRLKPRLARREASPTVTTCKTPLVAVIGTARRHRGAASPSSIRP